MKDFLKINKIIETQESVIKWQKNSFERLLSSKDDEIETLEKDIKEYSNTLLSCKENENVFFNNLGVTNVYCAYLISLEGE